MAARINPPRVELPADTLGQDAENRRRRVALLLTTRAGEQGGARDFGLDWSVLDGPIEVAKATLQADIVTKINKYTPDVAVTRIEWSADADGSLTPKGVLKLV